MADGQHKLSRRALLGAVCASPLVRHPGLDPGSTLPSPAPEGKRWIPDQVRDDGSGHSSAVASWGQALARLNEAQTILDAGRSEPDEDVYDRLLDSHSAALRALLAPDLPSLAAKLEIIVPQQAWELTGSEGCLEILRHDARRLAANSA